MRYKPSQYQLPLFKTCAVCKNEKALIEFRNQIASPDGKGVYCHPCQKTRSKERYLLKKDDIIKQVKAWQQNHSNFKQYQQAAHKKYLKKYPVVRWRRRICQGYRKKFGTQAHIGATTRQIKQHIESFWDASMNWENYGKTWQIVRIKPSECHYTNFRPQLINLK